MSDLLTMTAEVLPVTRWLIAIWCVLSTLEWIANTELFAPRSLLSWRVLSLRDGRFYRNTLIVRLLGTKALSVACVFRLAAAAALVSGVSLGVDLLSLSVIAATSWLIAVRTTIGGDGSDQMGYIVSVGTLVAVLGLILQNQLLAFAGVMATGGQLVLAYFVAGFSKLLSPTWRNGTALRGVMDTYSYGHSFAAAVSGRSNIFSLTFCWLVILGETLFPVALLLPPLLLYAILGAYLVFHLSNAYFMGLNAFVWAFAAAYPSVVLLSKLARNALAMP